MNWQGIIEENIINNLNVMSNLYFLYDFIITVV